MQLHRRRVARREPGVAAVERRTVRIGDPPAEAGVGIPEGVPVKRTSEGRPEDNRSRLNDPRAPDGAVDTGERPRGSEEQQGRDRQSQRDLLS